MLIIFTKDCHYFLESTISCKIKPSFNVILCFMRCPWNNLNNNPVFLSGRYPFLNSKCSVSHFGVLDRYWFSWLTINTRLMNMLVFLMSLLRSKYDSLLTVADGLLSTAVAPSIIVQLVCSSVLYLHFTCFIRNIWFIQLCW